MAGTTHQSHWTLAYPFITSDPSSLRVGRGYFRQVDLALLQFQLFPLLLYPPRLAEEAQHRQRPGNDTYPAFHNRPENDFACVEKVVVIRAVCIGVYCANQGRHRGPV